MFRRHKIKTEDQVNYDYIKTDALKTKRPRSFTIPIEIADIHFSKALFDIEASINLMPLSINDKLGLGELKNTQITLHLADRPSVQLKGVLEDVLVKMRSFIIPIDFIILDFDDDRKIPILLGRPFLAMSKSTIDLEKNELTIRINGRLCLEISVKTLNYPKLGKVQKSSSKNETSRKPRGSANRKFGRKQSRCPNTAPLYHDSSTKIERIEKINSNSRHITFIS
ncbi:Retrovirus-related Pol polyprotein from transposon opus [Gossypium australe]|uniref:Retrovirus-related Pol polyprotein from transposon opus n=1 Tax=Gossypium australe TaxID=47621 RepID=A0A5B6X4M0_9ROSI|nr:Retrovirus-related Pol polyprotein from transposon opus [Gossypium australe]